MLCIRWTRMVLFASILGAAASTSLLAQTAGTPAALTQMASLSPAEREVWAQEEKFWATIEAADLEGHLALYADDITTYVSRTVRNGKDKWRESRAQQFSSGRTGFTYQLRPLSVRVYGDTGVAIYHAQASWTTSDGKPVTYNQSLMHIHQRTPDGWEIIAGTIMSPPAPAE